MARLGNRVGCEVDRMVMLDNIFEKESSMEAIEEHNFVLTAVYRVVAHNLVDEELWVEFLARLE